MVASDRFGRGRLAPPVYRGRSTYFQLLSLCQRLTTLYDVEHTDAYIREAADAYRKTGLLKMDEF